MSFQEKFRSTLTPILIVVGIVVAIILSFIVNLPFNCFWEIVKTRILNFLYRTCPCLHRIAHPNLPNDIPVERRIIALEREQARQADFSVLLEDNRAVRAGLNAIGEQLAHIGINIHHAIDRMPMAENDLPLAKDRPQVQPPNLNVLTYLTLYLPSRTNFTVWTWVTDFLRRRARGPWLRWRGSIVIQASLFIDSCVLAEIGELLKKCCSVENGFTLQIASWGIFYHNADSVHLLILKEGDVPINFEARWNKKRTGITMRGLHLNGVQIKATTKHTSTTLRSSGPPSKGYGNLDELHFPSEGFKCVEKPLIHAAKAVEFDGMLLIVRSEASYIVPPKPYLKEILQDGLEKILKMTKAVVDSNPNLQSKQQLAVEHWKRVSEMEMIDWRKNVIIQFQNLPVSKISTFVGEHFLARYIPLRASYRDKEYWQRALHDLNESSSQSSTVHSTGGRIKFLLRNFESSLRDFDRAIQDFDRVHNFNTDGLASTLLDRAIVKCVLARYPEAMQDINRAAGVNPNNIDVKRFQACLVERLCMDSLKSSTPVLQPIKPVYDLLTGDRYPTLGSPRYSRKMPPLNESMEDFGLSSTADWTEVMELSKDLAALDLEQGTSSNHDLHQMVRDYLSLYKTWTGNESLRTGKKLAEGGQAEIFEAVGNTRTSLVLKVFKQAFPLQTWLQPGVFQFGGVFLDNPYPSPVLCTALGVTFLEDRRCAFVFPRCWGDLRRLIHQQMVIQLSPFKISTRVKIMLQIAEGMRSLHIRNILHRDLKTSNVLVSGDNPDGEDFRCMVADFECSVGVVGTGFYRAPEILYKLKHGTSEPTALPWSTKTDVYSFAVVCFEILTGDIPFQDLKASDWEAVLYGHRPQLPESLDSELKTLFGLCWHADPGQRPSFSEICQVLAQYVEENAAGPEWDKKNSSEVGGFN